MTYCLAIHLKDGIIFAADSRTNAGVDHISTYRKLHKFCVPNERTIVCLSAGNLATTQSVINSLKRGIKQEEQHVNNVTSMYNIAEIIGEKLRTVIQRDSGQNQSTVSFDATFIVGGQIQGEEPRLFLIYPEGNFIECSEDTSFFQIGETKYGKPILDRVIEHNMSLDDGITCALLSLDSTLRSNISVGLPLYLLSYKKDSFSDDGYLKIDKDHEGFREIGKAWSEGLKGLFDTIPKTIK